MQVTTMGTTMQGRGITAGTAAKVGAGAVVGGVAGRVIGGNATGTVVGAVAGAAAGGVVAHETRTLDIVLPDGAPIRAVFTSRFSPGAAPRATTD
jgi:outer membrane lipoprotein SlyB